MRRISLALIKGTDNGYLTIPLGKMNMWLLRISARRRKYDRKYRLTERLPSMLKLNITGNLVENFPHRETLMKEKKKIERQAEMLTKRKIRNLIAKLQGFNSDPVGFGGKLRIKYPHQWKQIDWRQVYPAAKFNVSAKFTLKETGLFR